MLLMVKKGIRKEIYHSIYWCAQGYKRYMKDYDRKKELSYLQYLPYK